MQMTLKDMKKALSVVILGLLLVLAVACAPPTAVPAQPENQASETTDIPAEDSRPIPSELTEPVWRLSKYLSQEDEWVPVLDGTEITAVFGEDANMVGSSGCNTYTANFEISGNLIAIGTADATDRKCSEPKGTMGQESNYLTNLALVIAWKVEEGQLVMSDVSDKRIMLFEASESEA